MKEKDKQPNQSHLSDDLAGLEGLLEGVDQSDIPLEEILAEYSDQRKKRERRVAQKATQPVVLLPEQREPPDLPETPVKKKDAPPQIVDFPRPTAPPPPKPAPTEAADDAPGDKVLSLWEEPENPLKSGFDYLMRRADEYADTMFEEEDHPDPNVAIAEKYIPGTDEEAPPRRVKPKRERPPRPEPEPPADTPPAELAKEYTHGLNGLRLRAFVAVLLTVPLLYLNVAQTFHWPLPAEGKPWVSALLCGGLGAILLLAMDVVTTALADPFRRCAGLHTLTALGALVTLGDGIWYLTQGREGPLPLCGLSALSLVCAMWGTYLKRRGLRLSCRTAAAASEPYLVTRDEAKWNGRGTFTKHPGTTDGFGSQMQEPDGAQRIYRVIAPVILLACVLFAGLASVGRHAPERFVWALSVILTAAAPLSGLLAFALPYSKLSQRLAQCGAALAGWTGVEAMTGTSGILITDADLFPPGSIKLNGIKIFGDWSVEKVVAVTASLIRDSGSGLEKVFHDLLRTQGGIYRHTVDFCCYEGGGLSAVIRNEQILVGSASFMGLMEVALPQGLNVKNAVFCAIDGELVGIFALNYTQPATIRPALAALIGGKVAPVLATRDFNIIPAMLHQRFQLPVEKMEFPPIERRVELSMEHQAHSEIPSAILCREGLSPFSDAVVGGRRLRRIVRSNAILACSASGIGTLLGFYLTFIAAYDSLSPGNMLVFLTMWLVPTLLLSLNINQY